MVTACQKRDPAFRQRVLKAYEYLWAVCGLDVRLGSVSSPLDASHIRWHQAGGPKTEDNGLALCVLHHETFDLGTFTGADRLIIPRDSIWYQALDINKITRSISSIAEQCRTVPPRCDVVSEREQLGKAWHCVIVSSGGRF